MSKRQTYLQRSVLATHPVAKRLLQVMSAKQTNLALSADVVNATQLLELADQLGPEICILKTHIDIIEDFTPALTQQLRRLADHHQFIIFEDRKFADIGHTVQLQYQHGIYHIADWADIVNAHVLPGPAIIEGLAQIGLPKARGLLLLAQMSSQGHLMDAAYIQKTREMAERHRDFVMGFISQSRVSDDPGMIHMTPGVQLAAKQDSLGQRYRTPAHAIVHEGCDVIIVGRGIIQAKHPLEMAREYRAAGWLAYQQSL
jgi:uridine monophosphate synthetase